MALTPKEQAFVELYRKDRNGTKAAIGAGYSEASAKTIASRLLTKANVKAAIAALDRAAFKKVRRSVEATLEEIACLAHSNIKALLNDDGTLKAVSEWPNDAARAIAGIEVFEVYDKKGEHVGTTKKLKFHDKGAALRMKGQHQKLFVEVVEHRITTGLADRLAKARARARAKVGE